MSKEMFPFSDMERLGRRIYHDLGEGLAPVAQDVVFESATGIAEYYGLPDQIQNQGTRIPVFRATKDALMETERLEAAYKKIPLTVDEETITGVALTFPGAPVILVRDDINEDLFPIKLNHELIHGMIPIENDKSVNTVNEAVVSVLEASKRNRHIPFFKPGVSNRNQETLYGGVVRGEVALSYFESSYSLMVIMAATHFGDFAFGPGDLARHYFGEKPDYQIPLWTDLVMRVPESHQGTIRPFLKMFTQAA